MILKCLLIAAIAGNVRSIRTCDDIWSYIYDRDNSCSDNPDDVNLPELVKQHNYQLESYKVTSEDGYIATVFNLRREKSIGVVFLLHPATASCTIYLDKGNASLAYALFHAGYDVWLGNFRGTFYAREHVKLNPKQKAYWNFSYHEMGVYDIPAQINLIKNQTKTDKVTVIGYSMGGTTAAIYASMLPDHVAKNVHKFILLAPAIFLGHVQSALKYLAPHEKILLALLEQFGLMELIPHNEILIKITGFCRVYPGVYLCPWLVQHFISGINETNINPAYTPILFWQVPAGLGAKCLAHYAQSINSNGRFAQYDYGDNNEIHYNSKTSPEYPIQNINTKIFLMSGTNDYLSTEIDVENFYNALPPAAKDKLHVIQGYTHTDFMSAINIDKELNPVVIDEVNKVYSG